MGILSIMSNSFGCSASGERLVSAARDGDLQEAKALLEYNPRLARYSTFGVRNSPLHFSAAQGHHEIVSLLLESGVDINLRNFRGETALMQACQYGHWEVVQTLILFKANIHKMDYINGGTALHFAALNGHARCLRLLVADYFPSTEETSSSEALSAIVNAKTDGGITGLHMAALNAHVDCVHLMLDLEAHVSETTVDDGTTIDLIGPGSTPLHYAACGGNVVCCQMLIAKGASLTAQNANGLTPLMVAQSWRRNWLEGILRRETETINLPLSLPSPFLSLPLMSIMTIAREIGWRNREDSCVDPCSVCLERSCTVSAQGCNHEFCTRCALYLCSTNSTLSLSTSKPGSIPCPLCRCGIPSFIRLTHSDPPREPPRSSLSLSSLCTACPVTEDCVLDYEESMEFRGLGFRSNGVMCMSFERMNGSLIRCGSLRGGGGGREGLGFRRSVSQGESRSGNRSWVFGVNIGG